MNYPTVFKHYETKSKKWAWFECAMCDARFMEEYQTEIDKQLGEEIEKWMKSAFSKN